MKGRTIITHGRFVALLLVAGAFACGDTEPEPDPNRPPVAVGVIPPLTVVEGESVTVDVSAFFSDPDGDNLTYSATSSDNSVLTVSVAGSNVTATGVSAGLAQVAVTATDPDGASASHTADVTVEAANNAPVVDEEIADQEMTAGDTLTLDVAGNFSDPDGDELAFAAESDNAEVAAVSVDGSTVTIVGAGEGSANVTVTATDPGALSVSSTFAVTVAKANQAPVAVGEVPPLPLAEGEMFSAPVDQFFMDPDGDTLTFTAESSDTTVVTATMAGSIITVTAVEAGMATITITATDPGGLSATQTANITVSSHNQGPEVADTLRHQTLAPGDSLVLDVSNNFTDPDGDSLTFTAESQDTTVATVSVDGSIVKVFAHDVGSSFISVTATDPEGLSATQVFDARVVSGNEAPEAVGEIPAQTVKVDKSVMVDAAGYFSDPNGDELTYTASSSDDAVAGTTVEGAAVTIAGVAEGTATVTITATDPEGLSAVQEAEVSVVTGTAPEMTDSIPVFDLLHAPLDDPNSSTMDTITEVVLDMADYFTDADGDELEYSAFTTDETIAKVTSIEGSVVTTTAVSSDMSFALDTTYIMVSAKDPEGQEATQEAMVLVANSDYEPWEVIEINEEGKITLTTLGFVLSSCFPVIGLPVDGIEYRADWSVWEVRKGTGWVRISSTYAELQICPYLDLPSAGPGTYRLVGQVSVRPEESDDDEDYVPQRRTANNVITKSDN